MYDIFNSAFQSYRVLEDPGGSLSGLVQHSGDHREDFPSGIGSYIILVLSVQLNCKANHNFHTKRFVDIKTNFGIFQDSMFECGQMAELLAIKHELRFESNVSLPHTLVLDTGLLILNVEDVVATWAGELEVSTPDEVWALEDESVDEEVESGAPELSVENMRELDEVEVLPACELELIDELGKPEKVDVHPARELEMVEIAELEGLDKANVLPICEFKMVGIAELEELDKADVLPICEFKMVGIAKLEELDKADVLPICEFKMVGIAELEELDKANVLPICELKVVDEIKLEELNKLDKVNVVPACELELIDETRLEVLWTPELELEDSIADELEGGVEVVTVIAKEILEVFEDAIEDK
ncbi:hypothetical protein B7494_g2923 [Chlorociboria aeruginascens]|nr:hypothetical protein B7494_g2923 [Chlorociboria aeruginascens]